MPHFALVQLFSVQLAACHLEEVFMDYDTRVWRGWTMIRTWRTERKEYAR